MDGGVQCKKCRYLLKDKEGYNWCQNKTDDPDIDLIRDCEWYAVKTNADSIRGMTDEELAEMLYCIDHIVEDDWGDYDPHQLIMGHAFRDEEDILEWLKSPAEEVSE